MWGHFKSLHKHRGLPLITYAPRGLGGSKPPIHFHCVLHAKRGGGVQIACKNAYVINGRPHTAIDKTNPIPFFHHIHRILPNA